LGAIFIGFLGFVISGFNPVGVIGGGVFGGIIGGAIGKKIKKKI
jgi:hypothetical protein